MSSGIVTLQRGLERPDLDCSATRRGGARVKDTSPDTEAAVMALYAARSPEERLRMACAMFDDAKALVEAGIRHATPDISPAELRVQIFERLYFGDFDDATRARFVAALRE